MRMPTGIVLMLASTSVLTSGCGALRNMNFGRIMAGVLPPVPLAFPSLPSPLSGVALNNPFTASFLPGGGAPGGAGPGGGLSGPVPGGDRKALIDQALQLAGVPVTPANESAVNTIVQHESAWNPRAINNTDVNARRGDPSRGLMQTIGSTFRANALPGYDRDIYDPLSNLIAGIRYGVRRYGSLQRVPGVASLAAGGPYKPY